MKKGVIGMADNNDPALAVRVSDNERWDTVGRLYRRPGFKLPSDFRDPQVLRKLIINNDLMPSVTNVIAVRNAPHLLGWVAKMVAEEAVNVVERYPGLIQTKPGAAIKYLKGTADRFRDAAGLQGTHIHEGAELLGQNRSIDHLKLTDYEYESLEQFKRYLDLWQPEIKFTEVTGFGSVTSRGGDKMSHAGTIDVIQEINGKTVVADYKCTVPEAPILLEDGSTIPASELTVGQKVVAWTPAKGLHVAPISYVGDNGEHKTITITTASGHVLRTTYNHPYLASRNSKQGFAKAEHLRVGDNVFLALGWGHNPKRKQTEWARGEELAPYLYGLLWSLFQFHPERVELSDKLQLPGSARATLREVLEDDGFEFNGDGQLLLEAGIRAISNVEVGKNQFVQLDVERVMELLNDPAISPRLLGADPHRLRAFFLGVQEVFANREENAGDFMAMFRNEIAAKELQQAYLNDGQLVKRGEGRNAHYVEVEFTNRETVFSHGDVPVEIVSIERHEELTSTVAIEVQDSHTHVTAGIITHNTNRSGAHIDVALQLAAGARFEEITPDNQTLVPMTQIEHAQVIHISPKGVQVRRVNINERIFNKFASLREVWDFHAFESKFPTTESVLGPILKGPSDF